MWLEVAELAALPPACVIGFVAGRVSARGDQIGDVDRVVPGVIEQVEYRAMRRTTAGDLEAIEYRRHRDTTRMLGVGRSRAVAS